MTTINLNGIYSTNLDNQYGNLGGEDGAFDSVEDVSAFLKAQNIALADTNGVTLDDGGSLTITLKSGVTISLGTFKDGINAEQFITNVEGLAGNSAEINGFLSSEEFESVFDRPLQQTQETKEAPENGIKINSNQANHALTKALIWNSDGTYTAQ